MDAGDLFTNCQLGANLNGWLIIKVSELRIVVDP